MASPFETASKVKRGAVPGLSILFFLVFVASGLSKLVSSDFATRGFEGWGYPFWFMYLVGLSEGSQAFSS